MKADTYVLEEFAAKITRLEKQRDAARAEAQRATERLEELGDRRATLGLGPLSDEWDTTRELASLVQAINGEGAALSRTRTIAEDAARKLDQLILRAKVRHREEEKRLARERYEALCEERYSLDGEAEEVMARLVKVLDRLEGLHAEQVRAAADADNSSLAQQDPSATMENWLARRLRPWLPNGSLERYDAPLPELDPLARKPEPDEGVQSEDREKAKPRTELAQR